MFALRGSLPLEDYPWPSDLALFTAPADEGDPWWERHANRVRLLITPAPLGASSALIARLPKLEHIAVFGVGADAVALETAEARGITVSTTGNVLHEAVADLALALVLASRRQVLAADTFVRSGAWRQGQMTLGTDVHGQRLGIFGMGRIGQAIARRARGFSLEVGHCSQRQHPNAQQFGNLRALAEWADILVVACPLNAETRSAIDAEIMAAIGPAGLLVNVARGGIVDEDALCQALGQGTLGAAALDVFASEPEIASRLLDQPNLILTPHIGSATWQTRARMADALLANVRQWLADCQTM